MMKVEGSGSESGSGSISQRHGSADPDPHQNVMDPQHCAKLIKRVFKLGIYIPKRRNVEDSASQIGS
jgi:hypothetical protein